VIPRETSILRDGQGNQMVTRHYEDGFGRLVRVEKDGLMTSGVECAL
jgi:hypothetical protein